MPWAFARLQANIAEYKEQDAICALVTDRDGDEHALNLGGTSSSILQPSGIKETVPEVEFAGQISITSVTLPTVMHQRDFSAYDALVIDTQGSELLVLRGASSILHHFRYIECEAADFELYDGYPRPDEIRAFLAGHGFRQIREDTFRQTGQRREFDMLFRRG